MLLKKIFHLKNDFFWFVGQRVGLRSITIRNVAGMCDISAPAEQRAQCDEAAGCTEEHN